MADILVVDNYDSFTHNIVHALSHAGGRCTIVDNDQHDVTSLLASSPDGIVLAAGPCTPREAGVCLPLVRAIVRERRAVPVLGICLGHQTIAMALGGRLRRARQPMHGKRTRMRHDGRGCLAALPADTDVVRYNSLAVAADSLPEELEACGWDDDGELLALRHRSLPLEGVQFHPESWLTPATVTLLELWVASLVPARDADGLAQAVGVGQIGPP